jgi:hypothetical protein
MIEIWKTIDDYPDYQASTFGNIRSIDKTVERIDGRSMRIKGRILKPEISNAGYFLVSVVKERRSYKKTIHRLIAKTFIKNTKNDKEVNHKDGNKLNNILVNLEWISPKENIQHAIKNGKFKIQGEFANFAKLKEKDVYEIVDKLRHGVKYKIISKKYNISKTQIWRIKYKKNWKHLKY